MKVAEDIFKGCCKGDRKAQEKLYHQLYASLMRITLRYVINEDDAMGIINKSLYKVFTRIKEFKGDSENFGGWIKRITVNESIDFIRSRKSFNSKHVSVDYIVELPESRHVLEIEEHPEYILNILEKLPEKNRAVFNLFVVEGYGHAEIAKLLGISEANSKWNLHQARKKLQKWITQNEKV